MRIIPSICKTLHGLELEILIFLTVYQNLCLAKEQILANNPINLVLEKIAQNLTDAGFGKIDYLQVCDEENLQPVDIFNPDMKSRLFIAIYADQIRLIDNIELY